MKKSINSHKTVPSSKQEHRSKRAARRQGDKPRGFVFTITGGELSYTLAIPITPPALTVDTGYFPGEELAEIAHAAGRASLSVSQYLNRVHRDYFARCDCGDKQSHETCRALGDNGD